MKSDKQIYKRHYRLTGRVQGVSFRYATMQTAQQLNLTGWVRNCSDGSVELHAYGQTDQLDQLHQWLEQGPPLAQVEQLELLDQAVLEIDRLEQNEFIIKR